MKINSSIGFEAELFLVDSEGTIKPVADKILGLTSTLKHHPVKEYTKEVIEINALPSEIVEGAIIDYINTFYEIDEIIQGENLYLLPMALYPGKYVPETRDDAYYKVKEEIIGAENLKNAARCTGFHFHYPLPQNEEKVIQLYNFFISLVPFFDLFMQSSPFFNSSFLAKDGRAFLYRDMDLEEVHGAYSKKRIFGGIPHYEKDLYSLLKTVHKRNRAWALEVLSRGYKLEEVGYSKSIDYYWGAVRLNPKVSTIELRSPDVNLPSSLLEALYFFRKASDRIMEGVEVVVSDGDNFVYEDNKLYLPSMDRVIQASYESSLYGFESDMAYSYSKKLFDIFGYGKELSKFSSMLSERSSFSDYIIEMAKSRGWEEETPLSKEISSSIVIDVSEMMLKEMDRVKERSLSLFSDLTPSSSFLSGKLTSKILEYIGEERVETVDLSRSSTARLSRIEAIILSPELVNLQKEEKFKESLNMLKDNFMILLPFFEKDKSIVKSLKKELPFLNIIQINDNMDEGVYVKTLKGLIKLWAEASGIKLTHILYFGVKSYEKDLMEYFGASATFNEGSEVKENADVLVDSVEELNLFLRNKNRGENKND